MEWVVLASRVEANIYKYTDDHSLKLIKKIENPKGRLKNKDLRSDRSGLSRAKFKRAAPYRLGAENNPHEESANDFAKEISAYLNLEWNKNHKLNFKVVAEPRLLGMIKGGLAKSKFFDQIDWLNKDLQNVPPNKWLDILDLKKIPMKKDMKVR